MAELPILGENHRDWSEDKCKDGEDVVKERKKKRRKTAVIIEIKNPLVRNIGLLYTYDAAAEEES